MNKKGIQVKLPKIRSFLALSQFLNDVVKVGKYGRNNLITTQSLFNYSEYTQFFYRTFAISKRNGEARIIHAPKRKLNDVLKAINYVLQELYTPNNKSTAFYRGSNVQINAQSHVGSKFVLNLDIEDFFYSFDEEQLTRLFTRKPFNMVRHGENIPKVLSKICTIPLERDGEIRRVLPQGSPASPMLTNYFCYHMDKMLLGVANRFKIRYTRYADDITFSGDYDFIANSVCRQEIYRIIQDVHGFKVKESKTRYMGPRARQIVTGVVVNRKTNVRRSYVKEIRLYLHFWESKGYSRTEKILHAKYNHPNKYKPSLVSYLSGKLSYMKQIKGATDTTFVRLFARYKNLFLRDKKIIY